VCLQEREREEAEEIRRTTLAARQQKIRQQKEAERRREAEQEEKMRRLEEINNNNQKLIAQHSSQHSSLQHSSRRNEHYADRPSSNRTYSVTSACVGEEEGERYPRDDSPPSKYLPMKPVRPRSRKTSTTSVPSARGSNLEQRNKYKSETNTTQQRPKPKTPISTPQYPEEAEADHYPPKAAASFYISAAEEAPTEDIHLVPCSTCGRKFAEERLAKHSKACVAKKKSRKPLDPSKMRTAGTDMAKYQHKTTREEVCGPLSLNK
jgi:hypothetical protein